MTTNGKQKTQLYLWATVHNTRPSQEQYKSIHFESSTGVLPVVSVYTGSDQLWEQYSVQKSNKWDVIHSC